MSHTGMPHDAPARRIHRPPYRNPEAAEAAHALLERVKHGADYSEDAITWALIATGDIGGWAAAERYERAQAKAREEAEEEEQPKRRPGKPRTVDVDAIRALKAEGRSYSQIASSVGCGMSSVHKYLTGP